MATAVGMILCAACPASAQAQRFDFAGGAAGTGWQRVPPGQSFTAAAGFGFETVDEATTVFSVAAPEGDYRVTVTPLDGAPLTIWAETRRLMVEAGTGPQTFTVNVRRPDLAPVPANAPGGTAVRLKDREIGSRSWDDRLTLEFDGAVSSVEITPVETPRVFLLGDSTVTDQAGATFASWGQMLPRFLDHGVSVANHAESGETLKAFIAELRLDKALSQMRPGDVVLIQFGHNDSKTQWPQTYAEAATTFRSYLRVYIDEARRRGATPILVTSPHRRTFGPDGRIVNSHGDYPAAVHAVGREQDVAVIDLNAASARIYEALGPERAPLAFADDGRDATHHNAYGAYVLARAVAEALRAPGSPLADHVVDLPPFDPDNPPAPETFPLRPAATVPAPPPAGS